MVHEDWEKLVHGHAMEGEHGVREEVKVRLLVEDFPDGGTSRLWGLGCSPCGVEWLVGGVRVTTGVCVVE